MIKIKAFSIMALSVSLLNAQTNPPPTPEPVKIPINPAIQRTFLAQTPAIHTSIKDQGRVGFCWSYSGLALIEGEHLKNSQEKLDLSEEYIGFMYLYEQIIKNSSIYFSSEDRIHDPNAYSKKWKRKKMKLKTSAINLFNDLKINFLFKVSEGAPDLDLVMNLVKRYGVVTESSFGYKIQGSNAEKSVEKRVMDFVNTKLRDPAFNKKYRKQNQDGTYSTEPITEAIFEDLIKAYTLEDQNLNPDDRCDSCDLVQSKESFDHKGQRYSPKDFLERYIGFNVGEYTQIKVTKENFQSSMRKMENSLRDGHAVQLGVILLTGYSEAVKGSGILMPENCGIYTPCTPQGGHAILAVNHTKDQNGDLSGIIIKNSWGPIGLDVNGEKTGPKGFQIITPDYLSRIYNNNPTQEAPASSANWFMHINKKYND